MAIAIFTTWTTYGTWLPGDERGWFNQIGLQLPDFIQQLNAVLHMSSTATVLDLEQRQIVEETIQAHCNFREWQLLAVNCRTNHVHVLVCAGDVAIEIPRMQFKAWATRKLKGHSPERTKWWTERGWDVFVDDEDGLARVIEYIQNQ